MKRSRHFFLCLIALALVLCLCFGAAAPARAAQADSGELLEKLVTLFGLTQEDYDNYDQTYGESLPIVYDQQADSFYLAMGGITAGGMAVIKSENCYADQVAAEKGLQHSVKAQANLTAATAVSFVEGYADTVAKADLITFQLDGVSLLSSCMNGAMSGASVTWEDYITDAQLLEAVSSFRAQFIAQYSPQYGDKTATTMANMLEHLLYQCVVYCFEMLQVIETIRKYNADAVVLILGLYNPLRNLTFTADGQVLEVGNMVDLMISYCDAYLLKHTLPLENTAFIDCSQASTAGYGNVAITSTSDTAITSILLQILYASDSQYADQSGHDHIRDQILGGLTEPCRHTSTTTKNHKKATCTQEGYSGDTVCTKCGYVLRTGTVIAKTEHTYGDWSESSPPTCTSAGQESRSCTGCGDTQYRTTETGQHSWDAGSVTKAPGCETEGVKTFTCTTCGKTRTESIAATGHGFDNGTVTKTPGCETTGTKTFTCATCGKTRTESIAATGHSFDNGAVTREPGCETEGEKAVTCTVCGHATTETIPATGHSFDNGAVTKEPGCETEGEKAVTCTVCGHATTETIPATGHNFGQYTSNQDATCQADGTKSALCAHCDATDTQADPGSRTGHLYVHGTCIHCAQAQPVEEHSRLWILLILLAVAIAGGSAVLMWRRKKTKA